MAESPKGKRECKWQLGGECSPCRDRGKSPKGRWRGSSNQVRAETSEEIRMTERVALRSKETGGEVGRPG